MAPEDARGQGGPDPEARHTAGPAAYLQDPHHPGSALPRVGGGAVLGPWVQSWATPDMFAVMKGTDAAMGAFRSSVIRECATVQGVPFSGC